MDAEGRFHFEVDKNRFRKSILSPKMFPRKMRVVNPIVVSIERLFT